MTEPTTMLSAVRLGWQLLARIPWLTRWLLRRAFPVSRCKAMLLVELSGSQSSFELLAIRPSHTLVSLELRIYNPLPFSVELVVSQLQANIDSSNLLNTVLNTRFIVPATGFGRIVLPELNLTDQQARWVRNLSREYTRVQFTLDCHCTSVIHDWDTSGTYEFPVFVRTDGAEQSGEECT